MIANTAIRITLWLFLIWASVWFSNLGYAWRWCCSHHWWQSYCDGSMGKWVCWDWTYSPTCGCASSNTTSRSNNSAYFATPVIPTCTANSSYNSSRGACECYYWFKVQGTRCVVDPALNCPIKYPWTVYRESDNKCICPEWNPMGRDPITKSCPPTTAQCHLKIWIYSHANSNWGCDCDSWYHIVNGTCTTIPKKNKTTYKGWEKSKGEEEYHYGWRTIGILFYWIIKYNQKK